MAVKNETIYVGVSRLRAPCIDSSGLPLKEIHFILRSYNSHTLSLYVRWVCVHTLYWRRHVWCRVFAAVVVFKVAFAFEINQKRKNKYVSDRTPIQPCSPSSDSHLSLPLPYCIVGHLCTHKICILLTRSAADVTDSTCAILLLFDTPAFDAFFLNSSLLRCFIHFWSDWKSQDILSIHTSTCTNDDDGTNILFSPSTITTNNERVFFSSLQSDQYK